MFIMLPPLCCLLCWKPTLLSVTDQDAPYLIAQGPAAFVGFRLDLSPQGARQSESEFVVAASFHASNVPYVVGHRQRTEVRYFHSDWISGRKASFSALQSFSIVTAPGRFLPFRILLV
jgi:hypothetical protein